MDLSQPLPILVIVDYRRFLANDLKQFVTSNFPFAEGSKVWESLPKAPAETNEAFISSWTGENKLNRIIITSTSLFSHLHATDDCRKDCCKSISTISLPIPDENTSIPEYQCPGHACYPISTSDSKTFSHPSFVTELQCVLNRLRIGIECFALSNKRVNCSYLGNCLFKDVSVSILVDYKQLFFYKLQDGSKGSVKQNNLNVIR